MATKRSLVSRWASSEGQVRANAIADALKRGTTAAELTKILAGFDCTDEVAPALDLRGIQFTDFVPLRYLDLTGTRLDHAGVEGYIKNCRLADAVLDGFRAENAYMDGDLHGASFVNAYLKGCRFYADLTGTNFSGANLRS
ncbi:MAG: pentapeptide repeat-containing protein, partial [Chloroflexota bacterium]